MTEHLANQVLEVTDSVTDGCVSTRGEHNLEDGKDRDGDSGSDYISAESEAESDGEDDPESSREVKDSGISRNGGITRQTHPKSIIIPSSRESEVCGEMHNSTSCSFLPTHPGLPVMPSVPPQSPQEKAQIAAREGKV